MSIGLINCKLCGKWSSTDLSLDTLIGSYIVHLINDHWDFLTLAHDRPDLLQAAVDDYDKLN